MLEHLTDVRSAARVAMVALISMLALPALAPSAQATEAADCAVGVTRGNWAFAPGAFDPSFRVVSRGKHVVGSEDKGTIPSEGAAPRLKIPSSEIELVWLPQQGAFLGMFVMTGATLTDGAPLDKVPGNFIVEVWHGEALINGHSVEPAQVFRKEDAGGKPLAGLPFFLRAEDVAKIAEEAGDSGRPFRVTVGIAPESLASSDRSIEATLSWNSSGLADMLALARDCSGK